MRQFEGVIMNRTESPTEIGISAFPDPCFLFDGLSRAELQTATTLLAPAQLRFSAGDTVVRAGEKGGRLFFLTSGRVSVYRTGGEKLVLINQLRCGDTFGAASLFTSDPAPTEIRAETDCRITVLEERDLSRLFNACPACSLNYIRFLSEKLVFLNRRVRDFSAATSDEKTACLLLNEADEYGVVKLRNVTALIRTINQSRASFYRSVASLISREIIEKNGNQIRIIKGKELKGILS